MSDQIDSMLEKSLTMAIGGSIDHAEIALKMMTRKAKLLGLDAPTKVQTEDTTPRIAASRAEILERIAKLQTKLRSAAQLSGETIDVTPEPRQVEPVKMADLPEHESDHAEEQRSE
jgi:hypothetical protein